MNARLRVLMVSDVSPPPPAARRLRAPALWGRRAPAEPLQLLLAGAARVPLAPGDDDAPSGGLRGGDEHRDALGDRARVSQARRARPRAQRLLGRPALEALRGAARAHREDPRRGGD